MFDSKSENRDRAVEGVVRVRVTVKIRVGVRVRVSLWVRVEVGSSLGTKYG